MFLQCRFCGKGFKRESSFITHYCNDRKKHEDLSSINGQVAFSLYEKWVRIRHTRSVDFEDFKASRFFNSFIKFANYYRKIKGLSDVDEFLKIMISRNIQPSCWLNDKVLSFYLDFIDKNPPHKKIQVTCNYIIKICESYECDTSEFFDHLEFYVLIDFIKLHKLSPWILLNSKKFIKWVRYLSDEEQDIIDLVIDSQTWMKNFNNDSKNLFLAKQCCIELGIQ